MDQMMAAANVIEDEGVNMAPGSARSWQRQASSLP